MFKLSCADRFCCRTIEYYDENEDEDEAYCDPYKPVQFVPLKPNKFERDAKKEYTTTPIVLYAPNNLDYIKRLKFNWVVFIKRREELNLQKFARYYQHMQQVNANIAEKEQQEQNEKDKIKTLEKELQDLEKEKRRLKKEAELKEQKREHYVHRKKRELQRMLYGSFTNTNEASTSQAN
jgi:hypothetical protein